MDCYKNILPIEKAVYTGELNLDEMIFAKGVPEYVERFSRCRLLTAPWIHQDISQIEDICLRRKIAEYLYYSMDCEQMYFENFVSYRCRVLRILLKDYPEIFAVSCSEFFSTAMKTIPLSELNVGLRSKLLAFLNGFKRFDELMRYSENPFEADEWDLRKLNLSPERFINANVRHFNFTGVENPQNRFLLKKYAEYELLNTGVSMKTLSANLCCLKNLLNMEQVPFDEWGKEEAADFAEKLQKKYSHKSTLVSRMVAIRAFESYLVNHDYIMDSPLKKYSELGRFGSCYDYKSTAVDPVVLNRIFSVINKIPDERLRLGFLIQYCVGMRCSEVVSLKWDCIDRRDSKYFINYFCIKMRKDVCNVIPKTLAKMIEDFKETRERTDFLFKGNRGEHITTEKFRTGLQKEFVRLGVKNTDGSDYIYEPHSIRHTMAVRMREHEIPLQFIQEQLHHANPDMTLAYIEYIDKMKIKKISGFIDRCGNDVVFDLGSELTENEAYADNMRKYINAQILPNGICARPVKLGICSRLNRCLDCPDFRTSCRNLEEHRQHLKRVEDSIMRAEEYGWLPQAESGRATREKLLVIIERLEKKEKESDA